jgi:linoleoyl-CoA desaturase
MNKISFPTRADFYKILKKRVEQYFIESNLPRTGTWQMFLKTGIILTWFVISYSLLVFFSTSLIMAIISTFALAQGFVLVGFNIMHDANHGSYSRSRKINSLMGLTLDLIGGSRMLWRQKHNILHHTYTNIDELDDDIHSNGLLRLSPRQEWHPWHRFQHLYALPIYSLLTLSGITFSDFNKFFSGRIGEYQLRKPSGAEASLFFLTKLFYLGYMLVLPLFFHPLLHVLIAFVSIHLILGFTLSIVFQLAHTVEGNTFPKPKEETGTIKNEWAIHQVETTANFAPRNKLAAWYQGGLNFQIEHHLFSNICHIHYPAISKIIKKTCQELGVIYVSYPTLRSAIVGHYRFLKDMGKRPQNINVAVN